MERMELAKAEMKGNEKKGVEINKNCEPGKNEEVKVWETGFLLKMLC